MQWDRHSLKISPPNLAYFLAKKIIEDLSSIYPNKTQELTSVPVPSNSTNYDNVYIPDRQIISSPIVHL